MALTTFNLVALPVLAGLVAGTGAIATFMTSSTSAPQASAQPSRHCENQTWPYIDSTCLAGKAAARPEQQTRAVRQVSAPKPDETPALVTSNASLVTPAAAKPAAPAAAPLTIRDTVLRQPQPEAMALPTAEPSASAPKAKRKEVRRKRDRRSTARAYQVPMELRDHRATRPVIVVRPLRYD